MIKNISNLKYLRSEIQTEGKTEREINRRLDATKREKASLKSVLCSRDIIIKTKKIIFKTII